MRKRASHQLEDRILALRPALYWPLNADDTGNSNFGITDQSGNGRNGTNVGSTTIGGASSLTVDPTDSATDFSGSGQYITSSYALPASFTVVGILNRDTSTSHDCVFSDDRTSPDRVRLPSGLDDWAAAGNANATLSSGSGNGQIQQFAYTFNGDTDTGWLRVYGRSSSEVSLTGANYSGNFWLGATQAGGSAAEYFDGKISHVAVFPRVLSRAEVNQIFMAGIQQHRQGLWVRERIKQLSPSIYLPLNYEYYQDDQSGNNYTMSKLGNSVVGLASSLSHDPGDSSTDLDGTSDSITTNKTLGGIGTIVGLANRDTSSSADPLFASQTANSGTIYLVSGGNTMSYMGGGDGNIGTWPGNGQNVAWAVKWNTTAHTIEAFINGTSQTETTLTGPVFGGNLTLSLTPSDYFDGKMSHVAVWDSALTTAQIQHIHDAMRKGPPGVIIEAAA